MDAINIPLQIKVNASTKVKQRLASASSVKLYDENLCKVFPHYLVGDAGIVGELSDTLNNGYYKDGYGPFWPSFASVNDGRDGKVLWLSRAALECILSGHQNEYLFQIEDPYLMEGNDE